MDKSLKKYNLVSKAHLFFYSKDDSNNIKLLLFKNKSGDSFSHIYTELNEYDNAPTFAISRKIATDFPYIFTAEGLKEITSKKPLSKEDQVKSSPTGISVYRIWDDSTYMYFLDRLSTDVVQYDDINNEMVYFVQIPLIDIDYFNTYLNKISFYCEFIYISTFKEVQFSPETQRIFNEISCEKIIPHITSTEEVIKSGKADLYIVLACKKAGKDQAGFFHFPSLLTGIYRNNKEEWKYLVASCHELPNEKMLSRCKAIIIPGSELNVYNDIEFLRNTEKFLKQLVEDIYIKKKYPNLKILGLCFGMQIIVTALGGKVEFRKDIEVERDPVYIELTEDFWDLPFVKNSKVPKVPSLKMCEAHGDHVMTIPEGYNFKCYGSSKNCKYEVLGDSKNIFMVQGHPEYHPPFMCNRAAEWYLSFEKKEPTEENIIAFLEKNLSKECNKNVNSQEWRNICYNFMKN